MVKVEAVLADGCRTAAQMSTIQDTYVIARSGGYTSVVVEAPERLRLLPCRLHAGLMLEIVQWKDSHLSTLARKEKSGLQRRRAPQQVLHHYCA